MRQNHPNPCGQGVGPARGLLNRKVSFEHFELTRFAPSPDLADYVEHHWVIVSTGNGGPYTQRSLSHPNQHLVVAPASDTGLFGAVTGVFTYAYEGTERVFGTKFRHGAFRPFFGRPVSQLTDTHLPVESTFSRDSAELAAEFAGLNDPFGMAGRIEDLLRRHLPPPDPKAGLVRHIVALAEANLELVSVAQLAKAAGIAVRTLQRLFDDYVGVSPKWVIDRYRMLEAVETLNAGAPGSLTELAHRLGYFDQAAFNHAFERLTGAAPSAFLAK
jgi:AraC-like DNA-binding protein